MTPVLKRSVSPKHDDAGSVLYRQPALAFRSVPTRPPSRSRPDADAGTRRRLPCGVVLPSASGDLGWCQTMTALQRELCNIEQTEPDRQFRYYQNVRPGLPTGDAAGELRADLRARRLSGLIIHNGSAAAVGRLLESEPDVPRVYLWADRTSGVSPAVTADGPQLIGKALRHLADQGCRRVAMVSMEGTHAGPSHAALFERAGLAYRPQWVHSVRRVDPVAAGELIAFMMDPRFDERPDGLVVADDNLLAHVNRALAARGVRVGQDVRLVAHCNWPWPTQCVLPMTRIGFDMQDVLHRALAIMAAPPPRAADRFERLPARFAWER